MKGVLFSTSSSDIICLPFLSLVIDDSMWENVLEIWLVFVDGNLKEKSNNSFHGLLICIKTSASIPTGKIFIKKCIFREQHTDCFIECSIFFLRILS